MLRPTLTLTLTVATACVSDDLDVQLPELVCPDGSGTSRAGADPDASSLFQRPWAELVAEAGTGVTVSPSGGAVLTWNDDVELDWSSPPEEVFLLPDCAEPAVAARLDIAVSSADVQLDVTGQVWLSGTEEATVAAWSVGGSTAVPSAWAADVAELVDGNAPDEVSVLLSLHPRNGSGAAPAPAWSVGAVWRDTSGQILEEREVDRGTWSAP